MVVLSVSSSTEGRGECTGEVVDYPSYVLDIRRESDLDMVHLVLFTGLILDHYQSAPCANRVSQLTINKNVDR